MEKTSDYIRYSVITDKNPREIVMLRGSGCRFRRCRFCDYYLDSSKEEEENFLLNQGVLAKVTGAYGRLEVINSGSFPELDKQTLAEIERVCKEKQIGNLHFEAHWMYREHIQPWKEHFKNLGITLKIKMGVETFDETFRKEVFDKGMEGATPEQIAGVAEEVCLLFGIAGQTKEHMLADIRTGLALFERVCINLMVENTTDIHPDPQVIGLFKNEIYPLYIENDRVDILLENTDFGVGGQCE